MAHTTPNHLSLSDLTLAQEKALVIFVRAALLWIQNKTTPDNQGICTLIRNYACQNASPVGRVYIRARKMLLQTYWTEWPEFSGSIYLPVPPPNGKSPLVYYTQYKDHHWHGKYGQSRRRLLNFLIKCTEYHLESLK